MLSAYKTCIYSLHPFNTASTFASSLELARQGQIELRQTLTFGPLLMRRRPRTETTP